MKTNVPIRFPGKTVLASLDAAKLVPWLSDLKVETKHVTATIKPEHLANFLHTLRSRPNDFAEGILFGLHLDVGNDLTDFRSRRGRFGDGSVQIVVDTKTGRFYADIDLWTPYDDVVNFVGHSAEVVGGWFRGWGKGDRQHGSADSVGDGSEGNRGDDHGDRKGSTA